MSSAKSDPLPARRSGRSTGRIVVSSAILAMAGGAVAIVAILSGRDRQVPPKPPAPVNVEVLDIEPLAHTDEEFPLPGQVEVSRVVNVSAEVAGRIEKIHLSEGRPCTRSKPLIQLNTDILAAEMRRDKATAAFAQRELGRVLELQARGVASTTEVDQARSQAEASKAAFDLAQAKLNRATILVPINGVLNRVPVEVGEYVTPGVRVAEIVEIDTVKVVVSVPEPIIHLVHLGDRHPVILDLRGNRKRTGEVTYIGELADLKTRTTRVELTIANPPRTPDGERAAREFRSGQIVKVRLKLRTLQDAIMVPLRAVIPLEEGRVVYVVEGDQAKRRKVKLGLIKDLGGQAAKGLKDADGQIDKGLKDVYVQITKGLKAGDRLIVKGQQLVGPDQQVHIVQGK